MWFTGVLDGIGSHFVCCWIYLVEVCEAGLVCGRRDGRIGCLRKMLSERGRREKVRSFSFVNLLFAGRDENGWFLDSQ